MNEANHEQHVHTVLKVFLKTEMFMKLVKCQFSVRKIFFVGFVITDKDVKMKKKCIITVTNWSESESIFEI